MKWYVYFNYPYPEQLGDCYDSLEDAIAAVKAEGIPKWNVLIQSEGFGIGGCHRAVWSGNRREWVNKRTGSTIEQEGWV